MLRLTLTVGGIPYARHWEGTAAESYHKHQVRLTDDVDESGSLAARASHALEAAASALTSAQGRVMDSLASVPCPVEFNGDLGVAGQDVLRERIRNGSMFPHPSPQHLFCSSEHRVS